MTTTRTERIVVNLVLIATVVGVLAAFWKAVWA